jgi:hypothetical protein
VISATSQRSGGPTGADEAPLSGNPSPETLRGTQGATEEKDIAVVLRAQKKGFTGVLPFLFVYTS